MNQAKSKLTIKDIKIKPSGQQVKEAILRYYGCDINASNRITSKFIDRFAEQIKLNPNSLKAYFRSEDKYVGSDTFRKRLTDTLDMGYDQIVLNEEQQIDRMVEEISENINDYNDVRDFEALDTLKDLCIKKGMNKQLGKMYRAIGMHYFNCDKIHSAIELLKLALNVIENEKDTNLTLSYYSELGLIYFYDLNYKKSKEILEAIEQQISEAEDMDDEVKFLYYYRRGILYNSQDENAMAEQMFIKSLEYAGDASQIGKSTMNIGLCYKQRGDYQKAIKCYTDMYELLRDDKVGQSGVLNNLAETYKQLGDYNKALEYIKEALSIVKNSMLSREIIYNFTLVEIHILRGEADAIDKLMKHLLKAKNLFLHKKYIISGLNNITELAKADPDILKKLKSSTIGLIRNTDREHTEFLRELKVCLANIILYMEGI